MHGSAGSARTARFANPLQTGAGCDDGTVIQRHPTLRWLREHVWIFEVLLIALLFVARWMMS
jgi:hypothetical protein